MALKIEPNQSATAYHIVDGPVTFHYAVDAHHAISSHPLEWSDTPWLPAEAAEARRRLNARNKEEGIAPLPEPAPLSLEDQIALDEHNLAVEAAAQRLAAYHKRKAEEKAEADQVAADEAILASAPPTPDPAARKTMSAAQIRKRAAMSDEEKAANDKITADKAHADIMGNAMVKVS